ncbi:MAG: PaaI family thioesterase [Deltaproteobacteria bacterium]|nr:PaaI family thioesterase [Deltaproteobacteria bacterium]
MSLTRTYAWDDPQQIAERARSLSGMEFLAALIRDGTRVPVGATNNFRLAEVGEGRCLFLSEPAEYLFNPIGGIHGGWYACVLDAALGVAVHTTLPAGVGYTTLEYKVNLTKAVTLGSGELRCEGKLVSRGRRVATSEARLTGGDGALYAHATSTCLILDSR